MADWQLSAAANADIEEIARYTAAKFGERQARKYTGEIRRAVQIAADFRFLARPHTTEAGASYQRYNIGRHAIFYRETEQGIYVLRILHGAMDFDRHLDPD